MITKFDIDEDCCTAGGLLRTPAQMIRSFTLDIDYNIENQLDVHIYRLANLWPEEFHFGKSDIINMNDDQKQIIINEFNERHGIMLMK